MDAERARREILLVEYQKAQDSAEHHDGLMASLTGLWVGSAVLMGFVLNGLAGKHAHSERLVMFFLAGLGMLLGVLVAWWVNAASVRKRRKYERCREIETELGVMCQHSREEEQTSTERWKQHAQTRAWLLFIACVLLTWVVVLVKIAQL